MCRLYLFQYEVGLRMANAANVDDLVTQHSPVFIHVLHPSLDQIVEAAGHHVTFDDLLNQLHGFLETLKHVLSGMVERHFSEGQQALTEPARAQVGVITSDETVALQ